MIWPPYPLFQERSRSGLRVPVAVRRRLTTSPRALFEAVQFSNPRVLLESARIHPVTGRYSILVGEPRQLLFTRGGHIEQVLQRLQADYAAASLPDFPPFVGGAVGYLSYDACRDWEKIPSLAQEDLPLPETGFLFCDETLVADHETEILWAIALARTDLRPARAYAEAADRAESLMDRATRRPFVVSSSNHERLRPSTSSEPVDGLDRWVSTHTQASFEAMVCRAKACIAQGEIYQANLSQRFDAPLREDPWLLYRRLMEVNPSPFSVFADFGTLQVVSASPERLVRADGEVVETRPIAGTRPRGQSALETARLRNELLANEKERAEHLMLVDLERNDLGRICEYGSVRVDDFMGLEEYSHVIHIVSNIRGKRRPETATAELLRAVFPGGTITGCPKIRCMQIIEELEPVRRHLYTGSFGYLSAAGEMDFNILIRSAFVQEGRVYVQTGAGIVADSDPGREYEETLHKARALLELIGPVHHEPVLTPASTSSA